MKSRRISLVRLVGGTLAAAFMTVGTHAARALPDENGNCDAMTDMREVDVFFDDFWHAGDPNTSRPQSDPLGQSEWLTVGTKYGKEPHPGFIDGVVRDHHDKCSPFNSNTY